MSIARVALAIAAACLIQGTAESRAPGDFGETTVAAIGNEEPVSGVAGAGDPAVAAPRPAAASPARIGNPLWAIPLRKLSATRERPLFSPSRRPKAPVIAAAPAPPATIPQPPAPPPEPERPPLVLVGTIIGENERIAIFVNLTSNETKRVREGQEEAGWTVRSVELRTTVLERNHRSVTLDLPKRDARPPPGGPSPGANPAIEQTL